MRFQLLEGAKGSLLKNVYCFNSLSTCSSSTIFFADGRCNSEGWRARDFLSPDLRSPPESKLFQRSAAQLPYSACVVRAGSATGGRGRSAYHMCSRAGGGWFLKVSLAADAALSRHSRA